MIRKIILIACLHSSIGLSAAVYPNNWVNGINTGLPQQPNPSHAFNNLANQFITPYNKGLNSVANGLNAGAHLSNQAQNNMRLLQNNFQQTANLIPAAQQPNIPISGQQVKNIGANQDRRFLQTAQIAVNPAQNVQMHQQSMINAIQNRVQSQQGLQQRVNMIPNPVNKATNPMLNVIQRNYQNFNRFNPPLGQNHLLYNQTLTRPLNIPQAPRQVDQNLIAKRLPLANVQPVNNQLPKYHPQLNVVNRGTTMNIIKDYDFINPLEVLRQSVSKLKLSNEQLYIFKNYYDIIKNAMQTFNKEFIQGYRTSLQGVLNTSDNQVTSGINQLSVIRIINNQLSYISNILNNIFTRIRSHIIEKIKDVMTISAITCDDLQGGKKPEQSVPFPSANITAPALQGTNHTVIIENQGNSTTLPSSPTINTTQIVNGTLLPLNETIQTPLNNVQNVSALLIDDGTIFKAYLTKINSTQETISKWDAMIKDKGEDGKLNLTSFAKTDPFCNCNDIVTCNCCITLNMTVISKQVCLEATAPKTTNGTKLVIIFDKTRQEIAQTKGLDEKLHFDLDGLVKGELEIRKRPGSTNMTEELCGVASLGTLGLRYPSLPLGCFRVSNDTINLTDDF